MLSVAAISDPMVERVAGEVSLLYGGGNPIGGEANLGDAEFIDGAVEIGLVVSAGGSADANGRAAVEGNALKRGQQLTV